MLSLSPLRRERAPPRGIKVEPKEQIRQRLGRSPDKGDAVALALKAAERQDCKVYVFPNIPVREPRYVRYHVGNSWYDPFRDEV